MDATCLFGCPLGIDIPGFIRLLREGQTVAALKKIKEQNPFPAICGRICPAPCEKACVLTGAKATGLPVDLAAVLARGFMPRASGDPKGRPLTKEEASIGIRALERYAADFGRERLSEPPQACQGKKVAVIGSGPMGLTAAAALAQRNYQITLFEVMEEVGGLLRYGIPEFRLPKDVLDEEIQSLKKFGIEIKTNCFFNKREHIKRLLQEGFAAVVLTLGGGRPASPPISGLHYTGVYFAQEFLMRVNHFKTERILRDPSVVNIGGRVVVLGSNQAALDCARIAVRMQREVTVVFASVQEDLRVPFNELMEAKDEGVKIEPLTQPLAIVADEKNCVRGVKCQPMDFADPDSKEQWQLLPVVESEFILEADTVIVSGGQQRNSMVEELVGLEGVFVPQQDSSAHGSVVEAMAAGKKIAGQMDEYLKKAKG